MRQRFACFSAVAFAALLCRSSSAFEADETDWDSGRDKFVATVPVEHSLRDNEYTVRCKMTYSAPKHSGVSKSKRTVSVSIDPSTFSVSDLQALESLAAAGKHYRVRLPSDVNNADTSPKIVASVPACLLIASDFHEIFRVHVDQFGHIRGLWYQTMAVACPAGRLAVPTSATKVVTTVSVDMDTRGPRIAVEPVAKPAEGEPGEKGKEPEKSFFQKYWYYIVGFVVLVMLTGGGDDKEGGGGGGGGGGRGG